MVHWNAHDFYVDDYVGDMDLCVCYYVGVYQYMHYVLYVVHCYARSMSMIMLVTWMCVIVLGCTKGFVCDERYSFDLIHGILLMLLVCVYFARTVFANTALVGRVDPLTLSISVSGGRETKRDSLSSGE